MIRAIIYAVVFYPATLVLVLACFVASLFGTEPLRAVVHAWAQLHHWLAGVVGTRLEVTGSLPAEPCLIAVKHQSMYETLEMLRLADTPVVVLKRQLSDIPLFGWATRRYGVIPVDREAGAKALREMLALGKQAAAAGRPVIIYPEGTRVRLGEDPPLQPGFAGLYRALGLPVVPVSVDSARIWGANLPNRRGTVHFVIGETIPPGFKRAEIEARVHAGINLLESGAKTRA